MADTPLQTVFNDKYITSVPTAALARWGITDLSQIGTRNWDFSDPTSQEGSGTIQGVQFYNKNTGEPIGTEGTGFLGEGGQIGVDAKGNIVGVLPATNEGFFSGLFGRVKDIVTNPGLQYIAGSALLGNLAAGALGGTAAASGAGAAGATTAEAAMNAALQQEIASGALGSAAMGSAMGPLTAEQLGTSFAADMAAAGVPSTALASGALSGLTASQIANLAKAGVSVAGLLGAGSVAANAGSSSGGTGTTTSGSTNYSPEYYAQLQQYYNKYLPGQPADVVSPLANWYESKFNAPVQGMLTPTQASAGIRMGGLTPAAVQQVQQLSIADKARTYNDLLSAGLTDAQARQTVEQQMGTQTPADWQYLQNAAQVQTVSSSTNPLVKAQEYNNLVAQGLNDTQIRSLVEASVGPQTDSDWQYLKLLAGA